MKLISACCCFFLGEIFLSLTSAQPLQPLQQSQKLLPDPPLGTGAAAFAGGGVAYQGGVNAIWMNPAALHIQGGQEVEVGMMGMSDGFSPYVLYGARLPEKSSYAVGYYYDDRSEGKIGTPARQGMIGATSWPVTRKTTLGVSMHSQGTGAGIGLNGFGVDADGGVLWQPVKIGWMGLSVKNIFESDVGQEPTSYQTRRSYLSAVGIRKSHLHFWGIDFQDPDMFYELRLDNLPPKNITNAFSLSSKFTPDGKLGFRSTVLVSMAGLPSFVMATFLNLPMNQTLVSTTYTFDTGGGDELDLGGERDLSHSISVNIHLQSHVNSLPPLLEIHADRQVFFADSTGEMQVFFQLINNEEKKSVIERNKIDTWKVELRKVDASGKAGSVIKEFHGKDLPPRMIRWNGKNQNEEPISKGFYDFQFSAQDASGNEGITAPQLLELKDPPKDSLDLEEIP